DYENDNLFMYSQTSKASIEMDDLVIDYDSKKQISGFELFNASEFFSDLLPEPISKEKLNQLAECKIDIIPKKSFVMIRFFFTFNSRDELFAPLFVPRITAGPATS
ncbi:MAG: DUF2283 domain-containing protein, partial [Nanobdellota archaeon]